VAVVGATASGKSDLALDLAERLGGEIVNTDAMQVYRGMDIGTAKLPVAERRGIPHHLLDLLDVTEPATVAEFQRRARAETAACRARGVAP
jgi:tRNA dimethylallyltransferase